MKTRIIAKLEVKAPHVVKPIFFEGLKKIGLPAELAKKYYEQGADELFYVDIVASLYQRSILFDEVNSVANELFIPYGVGGGVRKIEDFSKLIHMGADKIMINTFALQEDPNIIDKAAKVFGSQSVVINIEAKKCLDKWVCYSDSGKVPSSVDLEVWVKEVESRGAGEILLQSVDNDGAQLGFDIDLSKKVVSMTNVPVIVCSGAGTLEDISSLIRIAKPSGVALSSLLHYNKHTINEIKDYLSKNRVGGF
jgi:imidazole glycerol-phosphate synthase subunit HisF